MAVARTATMVATAFSSDRPRGPQTARADKTCWSRSGYAFRSSASGALTPWCRGYAPLQIGSNDCFFQENDVSKIETMCSSAENSGRVHSIAGELPDLPDGYPAGPRGSWLIAWFVAQAEGAAEAATRRAIPPASHDRRKRSASVR